MKKITFISNSSWNIKNFRAPLITKYLVQGYDVHVCVPENEENLVALFPGIYVHTFFMKRGSLTLMNNLYAFSSLLFLLLKIKPDILFSFTPQVNLHVGIISVFVRGKFIPTITGMGSLYTKNSRDSLISTCIKSVYRFVLRRAYLVFVQNETDELIVSNLVDQKVKTKRVPGSGIDVLKFDLPFKKFERPKIAFIGRFLRDKGLREFLRAIDLLKKQYEFDAFIIGKIDQGNPSSLSQQELVDMLSSGNIMNLGFYEDIREALSWLDCVCLPSYREGTSRVLLEAMACRRFVVTTKAVGCEHLMQSGKNGLLCEVADVDSLCIALRRFLEMSDAERNTYINNARQYIENEYNQTKVAQLYFNEVN
jgi:glycosyltransferase involved in cell wall biosynthesis